MNFGHALNNENAIFAPKAGNFLVIFRKSDEKSNGLILVSTPKGHAIHAI